VAVVRFGTSSAWQRHPPGQAYGVQGPRCRAGRRVSPVPRNAGELGRSLRDSTAWAFRIPASSRTRAAQRRAVGTSRRGSLTRGSSNSKARTSKTSVLSKPYRGGRAFIKVGETRSPVCRTSRPPPDARTSSMVSRITRPPPHPTPAKRAPHAARPRLQGGGPQGTPRSRRRCRRPGRAPRAGPRRMTSSVHLSVVPTRLVQRTRPARDRGARAVSLRRGPRGSSRRRGCCGWRHRRQRRRLAAGLPGGSPRAPQPWRWDGSGVRTGSPRVSRRGHRKRMRRCRAPPRWRSPGPRSACGDRRQPEHGRARRGGRRHPPILVRGRPG
jgi:hypothetical protein